MKGENIKCHKNDWNRIEFYRKSGVYPLTVVNKQEIKDAIYVGSTKRTIHDHMYK